MLLTLTNRQRSLRTDPAALRLLATALYSLACHAAKKPRANAAHDADGQPAGSEERAPTRARGRVRTLPQGAQSISFVPDAPFSPDVPPAPPHIKDYEEIRLTLCGDAEISRIHQAVFDDPETTDVITIPYAATPAEPASAEIFVNAALALRVAKEQQTPPAAELALYIAHGFDHLAGHDDHSARGYDSMRRRELSWLDACEKQGILNTLRGTPEK